MKNQNLLLALSCVGLFTVSCGKDNDEGSSRPSVQQPSLDLINAGDFKNTAKNSSEVGAKFKEASNAVKSVDFGSKGVRSVPAKKTTASASILNTASVQSFLDNSRQTRISDNMPKAEDCASQLKALDSVYQGAASGLQETASALQQFDGELPEGITRGAANEQFAVSYTLDLGKLSANAAAENAKNPASQQQEPSNVSGLAQIGAGANATTAVISVGFNATASSKQGNAAGKGGFAASANTEQKLLKLTTNADINATDADKQNLRASLNSSFALQAGANPSINVILTAVTNVDASSDEVQISDKDHAVGIKVNMAKAANNEIEITYNLTADEKSQNGKLTLATDPVSKTCEVKNSTSSSAPTPITTIL